MKLVKTCRAILLVVLLATTSFGIKAEDKKQYCASEQEGGRVTIQCNDGTISVTTYGKFIVCAKNSSGDIVCQEKNL